MMNNRIKRLPVILEVEEVQKILDIPNKRYITGLRNKVILNLMWNMGLRVSEVVNLKPRDVNLTKRTLRIVNGKGGVDRDITIPEGITYLLKEWKDRRPKVSDYFICNIKNRKAEYLVKINDGRTLNPTSKKGDKLSVRTIQVMLKNYSRRAGIDKTVTPHTLRHSYATEFIRQGKSVMTLKQILGHSDIGTTQLYVTLANKDVEEAINGYMIKAV
jgi:integrase/recombinase XerD